MHSTAFSAYPQLTPGEFALVCHDFDRLYRQATLGPLRRRWRLAVRTAFGGTLTTVDGDDGDGVAVSTYLQITRPLEEDAAERLVEDALAGALEDVSLGTVETVEDAAMAEDMVDEAALHPPPSIQTPSVVYEVHWHPTYRAPCLWFCLRDLPDDEPALCLDTVFRRLVPSVFRDSLRAMGALGGISADNHPLTGVPSFFVHPCLLGEAMVGFDCSTRNYLTVWLGLVGGCVGLCVPRPMALLSPPA